MGLLLWGHESNAIAKEAQAEHKTPLNTKLDFLGVPMWILLYYVGIIELVRVEVSTVNCHDSVSRFSYPDREYVTLPATNHSTED